MSIGSCENKTILKLCDRKRPIYKSRIFNHNWIQLLYYITALIHSQKTFFLKGSLFLKLHFCVFLRPWVVNSFGQTSCCYYYRQQTQLSRQEQRQSHKWRHANLTWHVTMMSRSLSRGLCVTMMRWGSQREAGDWGWSLATGRGESMTRIIKRGSFKINEFLLVALIKSTPKQLGVGMETSNVETVRGKVWPIRQ